MLLSFDVAAEATAEHDDWHTHEHLPERLSIPGFIRGTRWVALRGQPRYFVMYEVAQLATLTSGAYLERLNNPSPWTSKIMAHYRGMRRGFCSVTSSFGLGLGHAGLLVRFTPDTAAGTRLRTWLVDQVLPQLAAKTGLASMHLLEGALAPPMTREQRIRGVDAGVDWAILATGYDADRLADLSSADLSALRLAEHGAADVHEATYRLDYALTRDEVEA
jgi:hypothetical protein